MATSTGISGETVWRHFGKPEPIFITNLLHIPLVQGKNVVCACGNSWPCDPKPEDDDPETTTGGWYD